MNDIGFSEDLRGDFLTFGDGDFRGQTRIMSANSGMGWDGVYHPLNEYYDGVIDSVAVYDTALSATDVRKLWDTGDKAGLHLTTKEYDDQAGLYYFWQRWYDPKDGRFTTADPFLRRSGATRAMSVYDSWLPASDLTGVVLTVQSLNRYIYSLNNSSNYYDPDGLNVVKKIIKNICKFFIWITGCPTPGKGLGPGCGKVPQDCYRVPKTFDPAKDDASLDSCISCCSMVHFGFTAKALECQNQCRLGVRGY
jgi:RHS repeat-associated protein